MYCYRNNTGHLLGESEQLLLARKPTSYTSVFMILICAFISYVILDKLTTLSDSQLMYLQNGHNNPYLTGWLCASSEMLLVKMPYT